jgi:hypothetical protein
LPEGFFFMGGHEDVCLNLSQKYDEYLGCQIFREKFIVILR